MTTLMQHPQPEFHRMIAASGARRFWLPPALVAASAAFYLAALMVALLAVLVPWLVAIEAGVDLPDPMALDDDLSDPLVLAGTTGMLALLIPTTLLALRLLGRSGGRSHSVAGRFRWRLLRDAATWLVPLHLMLAGLPLVLSDGFEAPRLSASLIAYLLVVLVMVPLQAAGEEYAFRVLPMQAIGVWFARPWLGIVVPVPLFVVGHSYQAWGLAAVGVFAVAMGALAWKSGGIEIPVLLHALGNMVAFGIVPAFPGSLDDTAISALAGCLDIAVTLALSAATWVWVSRRAGVSLGEPVRGADWVAPVRVDSHDR